MSNSFASNIEYFGTERHFEDIVEKHGLDLSTLNNLSALENLELYNILQRIISKRAKTVTAAQIIEQFEQTRFCRASNKGIRQINTIENEIFLQLPEEVIPLDVSHLNPFGMNALITKGDQKKVLTTIRNYDLNSDLSSSLVLEGAVMRKKYKQIKDKQNEPIKLLSNYRTLRTQHYPGMDNSRAKAHFKVSCFAMLGRDIVNRDFEHRAIYNILDYYLGVLDALNKKRVLSTNPLIIRLSDMRMITKLFQRKFSDADCERELKTFRKKQIIESRKGNELSIINYLNIGINDKYEDLEDIPTFFGNKYNVAGFLSFLGQIKTTLLPLIGKYPGLNIAIEFDLGRAWGSGHYNHLAFEVVSPATNGSRQGEWVDIMDGGSVDRSRRLLSDNKEKALVGGFGTDYLANYFLVNGK